MFHSQSVHDIDLWLDGTVSTIYKDQPLAQDWARISKVGEEYGEAVEAFIGTTGQNPRKGITHNKSDVLDELADTAWTAIFAIQHFTKNTNRTEDILRNKLAKIAGRVTGCPSHPEEFGDH